MTIYQARAISRQETVDEVLKRILSVVQPRRVVLFGSAVRGEMTTDSDLDLLVIIPGPAQRNVLAQKIYRNLHGIKVPVDIVVATEQDVVERGQAIGSILSSALREGQIIYDSTP